MLSPNTSFSCFLVFIIPTRYYVNDIYEYVDHIGSCIDWQISSVILKGLLIILSSLGGSLILFCIGLGQNSLIIITYAFLMFYYNFYLFISLSIFILHIYLKDSFSGSSLIGSSSVGILLIGVLLLKSKTTSFRVNYKRSIPFKN